MGKLQERIKQARAVKKMTQEAFAAAVGVSRRQVIFWENGSDAPSSERLPRIAATLGVTTDWLLGNEPSKETLARMKKLEKSAVVRGASKKLGDILASASPEVRRKISEQKLTYADFEAATEFCRAEIPQMHDLPVVGKIAADHMPSFAEAKETQLTDIKYNRKNHYVLLVTGRSMHPTIYEGDRVIVEAVHFNLEAYDEMKGPAHKQAWLKLHQEVVCAIVNDQDPIMKRLFVYDVGARGLGFEIFLQSDNRRVDPIIIRRDTSLRIVGVVREIVRSPKNYE